MLETERKQRNFTKLQEVHPGMRARLEAVLRELEAAGFRPRIQEAWRSPQDQLAAFNTGKSRVRFGFHNVTSPGGLKEALAADVWDDDRPTTTKTDFMLRLAAAAEKNGLATGIRWDLSENRAKLIDDAIAAKNWKAPVWVGWDPLHVEVTGLTIEEAREGKRPPIPGAADAPPQPPGAPAPENPSAETPPAPKGLTRYRVLNLESGRSREYETSTPLKPVTLLSVPYVSQLGAGADSRRNDCGAAAAVMLLEAYTGQPMTPDAFYNKFNIPGDPYLSINQLRDALGSEGVLTELKAGLTLRDLFGNLLSGRPGIVLIKYSVLRDAGLTEKAFSGPHFSVAVGMDLKYIYLHDPLYNDPDEGEARPYPLDIFLKAWTDVATDNRFPGPQRAAITPLGAVGIRTRRRVRVNAGRLNAREGPGTQFRASGFVSLGQIYDVTREVGGWGEIGEKRWVYLAYTQSA